MLAPIRVRLSPVQSKLASTPTEHHAAIARLDQGYRTISKRYGDRNKKIQNTRCDYISTRDSGKRNGRYSVKKDCRTRWKREKSFKMMQKKNKKKKQRECLLTFWCTLLTMRLHCDMSIQMIKRAISLLAAIPSTLVHTFDLFIASSGAFMLLSAGNRNKGVHL
jgi:hypothetical protein